MLQRWQQQDSGRAEIVRLTLHENKYAVGSLAIDVVHVIAASQLQLTDPPPKRSGKSKKVDASSLTAGFTMS